MNTILFPLLTPKEFQLWMEAVDDAVLQIPGVSVHDLPDRPFRDMFEDGASPREAAQDALEYAGW